MRPAPDDGGWSVEVDACPASVVQPLKSEGAGCLKENGAQHQRTEVRCQKSEATSGIGPCFVAATGISECDEVSGRRPIYGYPTSDFRLLMPGLGSARG